MSHLAGLLGARRPQRDTRHSYFIGCQVPPRGRPSGSSGGFGSGAGSGRLILETRRLVSERDGPQTENHGDSPVEDRPACG